MEKVMMLACHNIKNELLLAMAETRATFPVFFIPEDLHQNPDRLRGYLQKTIDSLYNIDTLLLPMGRCGNGTLGLCARRAKLVLPRCSDCIDLLLNGAERDKRSFYLTAGWLDNPYSIDTEYAYTLERYGEKRGSKIIEAMYHSYETFVMLDTGAYDLAPAMKKIAPLAEAVHVTVKRVAGGYDMLRDMVAGRLDEHFVTVPPGVEVAEGHFVQPAATGVHTG